MPGSGEYQTFLVSLFVIQSMLNINNILWIDRCAWEDFQMRLTIRFSFKSILNASMWHIYQMCTETVRDAWVVCTVYSAECSTLALVQAGKCQLAGLTESVHNTVINIQMSTS